MNQKKTDTPPKMKKFVGIKMTEDMYEVIRTYAEQAHMPIAEYCRNAILDKKIVVHQEIVFDSQELLHVLGDMGKIGSNLNQIAHHLNGGGSFDQELKSELYQAVIALNKIRDNVKALAGEYRES